VEEGRTGDFLLVLVHADNGLYGISRGGSKNIIEKELAPLLVGKDLRQIACHWQAMYEHAWRFRGPGRGAMSSIGAVDIALWDLYGKSCGQPVWRLLGGYRDRVPVYADGIGYYDQSPEEMADLVRKHANLGYEAVKFHLTTADPDAALAKVRLARQRVGPEVRLMIDVWGMWDGPQAAEMARKFAPYNLYWIEEPVRKDDETAYLQMVRDATEALVAGGESEGTLFGVRRLVTEGGLEVIQSDILIGGGYTGLLRIAALAEAYHVAVAPHGAQYPDLNCHLVAAIPNGLMIPACPRTEPYQIWSKLYRPRFQVVDGQVQMKDEPGLGLEFDWDFVRKYRLQ
jgi:D-arabinonate dehydratase